MTLRDEEKEGRDSRYKGRKESERAIKRSTHEETDGKKDLIISIDIFVPMGVYTCLSPLPPHQSHPQDHPNHPKSHQRESSPSSFYSFAPSIALCLLDLINIFERSCF